MVPRKTKICNTKNKKQQSTLISLSVSQQPPEYLIFLFRQINLALIIACARAPVLPDEPPPTCSSDAFSECGPVLNQSAVGAGSLETGCAKSAQPRGWAESFRSRRFPCLRGNFLFFYSYVQKCCSKKWADPPARRWIESEKREDALSADCIRVPVKLRTQST